ncbi:MAG TPA: hypothetical protein VLW85_07695 [Myxococcales bacterium]|nr:hypothetical protein [Myxococcales bacterium]
MRTLFAAVLVCSAPAFATFRCPARGGSPWREYRGAHFILDTDAGDSDAQALIQDLEHFHALILQALVGEQVAIPGHVRVLAFADQTAFEEIANNRNIAAYFTLGQLGEPTIVMPVRGAWERPEMVAHELAHYLSRYLFPVQPAWFAEGLAEFVQTAARRAGGTAFNVAGSHVARGAGALGAVAGSVPIDLVSWIGYDQRPLPAKELLGWTGREQGESPRGHLYGWLLYHWLWNQRSKAFTQYQKLLGDDADPASAWSAAFPEFNPKDAAAMARLDQALDQYRRHGQFAFYKVEAKGDETVTGPVPISSADLHLLIIPVANWSASSSSKTPRGDAIDEALVEDPGNPMALFLKADRHEALAVRRAADSRAGDWRAWLFVGMTTQGADAEAADRKAVAMNPESALALNNLAWLLATTGRAKEALPFANRALDLAPWDANTVDTLAEVAVQLGQCPQALQLEKRAVVTALGAKKMRERQSGIESRCAEKK